MVDIVIIEDWWFGRVDDEGCVRTIADWQSSSNRQSADLLTIQWGKGT